jgi:hypothetical protein
MDIAGFEGVPELSQVQGYVKRQKKKST